MSYLVDHWSFDPFLVLAAVTVVVNELGLRRLARRSDPRRTRLRRRRALAFYGGLLLLLLAVESPIDYWASRYFFVHMVEHIVMMFFAPMLVVVGAPWVPLLHAFPVSFRRRVGRALAFGSRTAALRGLWRVLTAPWTALIAFNAAMIFWHVPGPFDLAERTLLVHVWLMHASFFVTGVMFWLQIIPSRPFHRRASYFWQGGAIVSTNIVMTVLAMALSFFTNHSWYGVYAQVPGVSMPPFADQQIGGAILWVCGDFWALPSLVYVVHRAMHERGNLSHVVEAWLRRAPTSAKTGWSRLPR